MTHYVAFIHKEAESCYGVSFPDFPGCTSAGDTLDEAHGNATEALRLHVESMRDSGDAIPAPSSLDDVMADETLAGWRDGATLIHVPLFALSGRTKRVNISLDENILEVVDQLAEAAGETRSGIIGRMARHTAGNQYAFYSDRGESHATQARPRKGGGKSDVA